MNIVFRCSIFNLLVFLFACNSPSGKSPLAATNDSLPRTDSIASFKPGSLVTDSFSIVSLIPELGKDTAFHPIYGVSVRMDVQNITMYSVYRLPRKNVFAILNKKTKTMDTDGRMNVPVYTDLVKQDTNTYFRTTYARNENNVVAGRFYSKVRSLKGCRLYYAGTYGYMHWIFFDQYSDTVYHVSQLMTF